MGGTYVEVWQVGVEVVLRWSTAMHGATTASHDQGIWRLTSSLTASPDIDRHGAFIVRKHFSHTTSFMLGAALLFVGQIIHS